MGVREGYRGNFQKVQPVGWMMSTGESVDRCPFYTSPTDTGGGRGEGCLGYGGAVVGVVQADSGWQEGGCVFCG